MTKPRDLALALRAKRYGARYSLRIVLEARRAKIPISAGFALVEKETGFRNVFGHDPTQSIPPSWKGSTVTKAKYLRYRAHRKLGWGMQGVGPTQLTWWEFQDQADHLGGCWVPKHNIRVGFGILGGYYHDNLKVMPHNKALRLAFQRFNGTGPAAVAYGQDAMRKFHTWHNRLKGA